MSGIGDVRYQLCARVARLARSQCFGEVEIFHMPDWACSRLARNAETFMVCSIKCDDARSPSDRVQDILQIARPRLARALA